MNVLMPEALPGMSAVADLRGIALAELPADVAAETVADRVTTAADETPAYTVGAFNSAV